MERGQEMKITINLTEEAYRRICSFKEGTTDYQTTLALYKAVKEGKPEKAPEPVRAYPCDPKKNTDCKKTACYAKGGECRLTLNPNYAKEE